jgi:hypothetical protein
MPDGGSYTQIDTYNVFEVLTGTLTNLFFGSQPVNQIFNLPASNEFTVGNFNTINIGSNTTDVVNLSTNADKNTFVWDGNAWTETSIHGIGAGSVINGAGSYDTLALRGSNRSFDLRNSTVSNLDRIQFHDVAGDTAGSTLWLTATQVNAIASNLIVQGEGTLNDQIYIDNAAGTAVTNMGGWFVSALGAQGKIRYQGNSSVDEMVTGASIIDVFSGISGGDIVFGANGDDEFRFFGSVTVTGALYGGNNDDTVFVEGPYSVSLAAIDSIETFNLAGSSTITITGHNGALNTHLLNASAGNSTVEHLNFVMGPSGLLDLSGMTFTNWGAEDVITITGDATNETITGTS